ncbi:phosphonate ABC transporter, permease protein PhnE [Pseudactinotalea sp.]|uniref:phosphonate ABC transporter, permease protein PhnE n=1 Tax=Pseudactinotalea sp. TaxID=1926260 RepID=UPI003B3B562B
MSAATPVNDAPAAAPSRPRKPPPSPFVIVGLAIAAAITVWAGIGIDFTLLPLFTDLTRGQVIIEQFLRPEWAFLLRPAVSAAFLETLYMAILASLVGCSVALVLAMLASKVTAPNTAVYRITRAVLALIRSLPDVAYGLIFVAVLSIGALPGVLALIMFNIGVAAKLTGETIDSVDRGPVEAVEAAGGSRTQRARWAVFPQVAPNYLSYCFYVFELNIRASLVLGIVGAGGIGQLLQTLLARFQYSQVSAIVVMLFVVVFVLDQVSRALRRRLT